MSSGTVRISFIPRGSFGCVAYHSWPVVVIGPSSFIRRSSKAIKPSAKGLALPALRAASMSFVMRSFFVSCICGSFTSNNSTYKVPHFKQFVTRSGTNTSMFILSGDYISKFLLVFDFLCFVLSRSTLGKPCELIVTCGKF